MSFIFMQGRIIVDDASTFGTHAHGLRHDTVA